MSKNNRPSPSASATLYAIGTKKKGGDGNTWIIKEDKNKTKRWGLHKKSQTNTKSGSKTNLTKSKTKPKPKFYNLDICVTAIALLWNQDKFKAFKPESVIKNKSDLKSVLNSIHKFPEPSDTINFTFKKLLRSKPKIIWKGSNVDIDIPIKIRSERKDYDLLLEQINQFVDSFQDGASDGYLEGDAIMYKSGSNAYEFVLENIYVEVYHKDKILKRISYPKYW